jgi:hypothetical protein
MRRFIVAVFALVVLGFAPTVRAASFPLALNCLWSGGACTDHSAPSSEVSESASLALLGTGLFGLATAMRRRPAK